MSDLAAVKNLLRLGMISLVVLPIIAQVRKSESRQRIYVVAVHDSSLFTLCPPAIPENPRDPRTGVIPGNRNSVVLADGRLVVTRPGSPPIILPAYSVPQGRPFLDRAHPDWQHLARTTAGVCPSGWIDDDVRKKIEWGGTTSGCLKMNGNSRSTGSSPNRNPFASR
jgi:hypothetical protein